MIYYVTLFNALFFSLTLNEKKFSLAFTLTFVGFALVNFLQEKYAKNELLKLIIGSLTIILSILIYYKFESGLNLRFVFFPIPLLLLLTLFNFNKFKIIDHLTYLSLEIIIFFISVYTWWNTNISLALWIIFIFLNGMLIYERIIAIKQKDFQSIGKKYENTLWIQSLFVFGYCISLITYTN